MSLPLLCRWHIFLLKLRLSSEFQMKNLNIEEECTSLLIENSKRKARRIFNRKELLKYRWKQNNNRIMTKWLQIMDMYSTSILDFFSTFFFQWHWSFENLKLRSKENWSDKKDYLKKLNRFPKYTEILKDYRSNFHF